MNDDDAKRLLAVYDPGTLVRARMRITFVTVGFAVRRGARGMVVRAAHHLAGASVVHWVDVDRESLVSNDAIEPVPS